jgi:hypothetical protein
MLERKIIPEHLNGDYIDCLKANYVPKICNIRYSSTVFT